MKNGVLFENRFDSVSIKDKATDKKIFKNNCDSIISAFDERVVKMNMLKLFRVFMEDSFRQMLYSINVLLILMSERHSFHVMFIFYSKKDIFKPI